MVVEASVTERMPDTLLRPNTPAAGRVTSSVDRSPSALHSTAESSEPSHVCCVGCHTSVISPDALGVVRNLGGQDPKESASCTACRPLSAWAMLLRRSPGPSAL